MLKSKKVSIIGGSDGPTSIFIASKANNKFANNIRKRIKEKREKKIIDNLSINPHTLKQLSRYITKKYGAYRVNERKSSYQFAYQNIKANLVLKYNPQLVHTPIPKHLTNYNNQLKLKKYFEQMEQRVNEAVNTAFVIEFEQYMIEVTTPKNKGKIQIDLEYKYGTMQVSYTGSGKNKEYNKIVQDIYYYYGVSKKDILNKTQRYQQLIDVLIRK